MGTPLPLPRFSCLRNNRPGFSSTNKPNFTGWAGDRILGRGGGAWEGDGAGGAGGGVRTKAIIPFFFINKWKHLEGAQGRVHLSRCRQGGVGPAEEVGVGVEGGTEGVAGEEEGAGVVGGEDEEEDKQMAFSRIRSSKTRGGTCWRAGRHNLLCRHRS